MFNFSLHLAASALVVLFYILGGQYGSAWRKYGIMSVTMILVGNGIMNGAHWWVYLPLALFSAALFLGYGEKSWFMKLVHNDETIRWLEGFALGIGMTACAFLQDRWVASLVLLLVICGAFQIKAGASKIGRFELLWEDVARAISLASALWMVTR